MDGISFIFGVTTVIAVEFILFILFCLGGISK